MVQVLPASEGFGSQLLNAFGQAAGNIYQAKADRETNIVKNSQLVPKILDSYFKQFDKNNSFDSSNRLKSLDRAQEYIKEGYDPNNAVRYAFEDLKNGFPERPKKGKEGKKSKEQQAETESQPGKKEENQSFTDTLQQILKQPAYQSVQQLSNSVQNPLATLTSTPLEKLKEMAQGGPEKFLNQSREEVKKQNTNRAEDTVLQKLVGSTNIPQTLSFLQGLDPTGIALKLGDILNQNNLSITPKRNQLSNIQMKGHELAGDVAKDLGLFNIASKAPGLALKAASGAGLFGTQHAVKTSVAENRTPSTGEVLGASAIGAGGVIAEPILSAAKAFIKKVPKAYDTVKSAVSGIGKGAVTEDKIVEEAVRNLEGRGVSVMKATEGDPAALNAIQKEATQVANTYKQAEKYNQKELEKIRGEKAEKIVESPLEKYYEPKETVNQRPATVAKEAERIKPLEAIVKQNERRLRDRQYDVLSGQNRLREGAETLTAAEKERIQSGIDLAKVQHSKVLNEIKSAEFEIRNKKPPITSEKIKEQIDKSFAEIKEGIKDPTAEKIGKLEKALEKSEKSVAEAEKLVERGELPGTPVFDEYIKIKEEYVKAYGELIDELKSFVKENKGVKEKASEVANAQRLQGIIEKTREGAKADIINQIDKRKAMKMLSGPSGALWKNLLKSVRTDVDAFKKDWVQSRKILSPAETKVESIAKKEIDLAKEGSKSEPKGFNKVEEGPKEKAQEQKAKSESKKEEARAKEDLKETKKKLDNGEANEDDIKKTIGYFGKYLIKLQKIPGAIAKGAAAGAIHGVAEEFFETKVPAGLVGALLPGSLISRGAGSLAASKVHSLVEEIFNKKEASNLKKLRNTAKFDDYVEHMKTRYSKARVNKILKSLD